MKDDTLYLQFPQWQGSSHRDAPLLTQGAAWLHEFLNYLPFERIEVGRKEPGLKRDKLLAKPDLLWHAEQTKQLINAKQPERIFTLGGDCGVDFLPITYLHQRYGERLAVVWLDAHADLNTPKSSPSSAFHGMVLRACMGEGDPELQAYAYSVLNPAQAFLAGVRVFDAPELAFFEEHQMKLFSAQELEKRAESFTDYLELLDVDKLHIHLDLDVLDPESFDATGYPTEAGLSVLGASLVLKALYKSFDVVGFTMTEFMPKDKEDMKALAILLANNPLL